MGSRNYLRRRTGIAGVLFVLIGVLGASAQTDCADGDGVLEMTPPKNMTVPELVQKFTAEETKIKDARANYTYTQDMLVQTLNGKAVDGQFHQITKISYDEKGKRVENVTFSEQPTLRQIQVSEEDLDDVRVFMPWMLTTEDAPQ